MGPQDVAGANMLLAISSSAAKLGAIARKKNKVVVKVSGGFSDSKASSDGTPTSPAPRRVAPRRRHLSPLPASDAEAPTGGSASAPAAVPAGAIESAGANTSWARRVETVPSTSHQREGEAPVVDMTVSDMTLTAPHFVSADFASQPEISPFVDGVCQIVAPSDGLSLFTELNEFSESCAAAESLFVRV